MKMTASIDQFPDCCGAKILYQLIGTGPNSRPTPVELDEFLTKKRANLGPAMCFCILNQSEFDNGLEQVLVDHGFQRLRRVVKNPNTANNLYTYVLYKVDAQDVPPPVKATKSQETKKGGRLNLMDRLKKS